MLEGRPLSIGMVAPLAWMGPPTRPRPTPSRPTHPPTTTDGMNVTGWAPTYRPTDPNPINYHCPPRELESQMA